MVTDREVEVGLVVMAKVTLVAPLGTTTLTGTCAAEVLLLVKRTVAPPVGANPVSVTVPVELVPPTTEDGLALTDSRVAAFTVSVAVRVTP
jgi:hypothetical protein